MTASRTSCGFCHKNRKLCVEMMLIYSIAVIVIYVKSPAFSIWNCATCQSFYGFLKQALWALANLFALFALRFAICLSK
jgi:hypothetical protein